MRKGLTEKQLERLAKATSACNLARLQRISKYDLTPSKCKFCSQSLSYKNRHNSFCSRQCSGKFNSPRTTQHGEFHQNFTTGLYSDKACLRCGVTTKNKKYCSPSCFTLSRKEARILHLEKTGELIGNAATIKRTLIEERGHKCEICSLTHWCGDLAPLVLDHINGKPVDNRPENLRLLCGNCNMQTETYAGRNVGKGGGRPYRKVRYQEGQSY